MSTASEALEHAEHAAHGAHGPRLGKYIGLTMAVLGVMLAFCAAMVGSSRTEFTKALVDQAKANSEVQAQSTRFRTIMAQLEVLSDQVNQQDEEEETAKKFDELGETEDETILNVRASALLVYEEMVSTLTVSEKTLKRLTELARKYKTQQDKAVPWEKSFEPVANVHFEAAESFERAQLCAEIGIVLASIALLLSHRLVWILAGLLGVGTLVLITMTFLARGKELKESEEHLEHAHADYVASQNDESAKEDEEILKQLEDWQGIKPRAVPTPHGHGAPAASGSHGAAPSPAPSAHGH